MHTDTYKSKKMSLIQYLEIDIERHKVIAVVGAGGKTSLIFALATAFAKLGKKVYVTTTTKMYKAEHPDFLQIGMPCPKDSKKIMAVPDEVYKNLSKECDVLLVEADGAKKLPMKVPAEHEPVIPTNADMVIGILGASAIGKPLHEVCFRHTLAQKVLGVKKEHIVNFDNLMFLLNSPCGQRKNVTTDYRMVLGQADVLDGCEWNSQYLFTNAYKYFTIKEN